MDVLIVTVRMLISIGFVPEDGYLNSPLIHCAYHNFGFKKLTHYAAKGMLVSKLFPDEKDPSKLGEKLGIEQLFDHPEVKATLFGTPIFALKDTIEFVIPKEGAAKAEEINMIDFDPDSNHVHWDGSCDIGEAVSKKSWSISPDVGNGDRVRARYCGRPRYIRVTYDPTSSESPAFKDIRRFKLKAPCVEFVDKNKVVKTHETNDSYSLHVVVRVGCSDHEADPVDSDIRLYYTDGHPIIPFAGCDPTFLSEVKEKLEPDNDWRVGDQRYRFVLFYSRMGRVGDPRPETPPSPSRNIMEVPLPDLEEDYPFFYPRSPSESSPTRDRSEPRDRDSENDDDEDDDYGRPQDRSNDHHGGCRPSR